MYNNNTVFIVGYTFLNSFQLYPKKNTMKKKPKCSNDDSTGNKEKKTEEIEYKANAKNI